MEACKNHGCNASMIMNKKGVYVCPECGYTATYDELHPEEKEIQISDKTSVSSFIAMRKDRDRVLSILRDTEYVLFHRIMLLALRFIGKHMEGRDPAIVQQAAEFTKNIETLRAAMKRRPTRK